jgi:CubicO group peptidase (beta-lactamase class C family)
MFRRLPILAALFAATCSAQVPPADLEAFLDGLVPLQLQREDIAGVTIAVVQDGKPIFAKGYGYADVARKVPVSPAGTLFRPGSISKLFTWTAVMQLVEQGKLDLDRDVNGYLDFHIPGKPITLRNIMTHTSGFEESGRELFVPDATFLTPLKTWLPTHVPQQIFAPGSTPAYSNYATAVAGYIVQRVSGEPFEQYIEEHIFKPLGMAQCSFRQPLPPQLKPLMSSGYQRASEPAKPYEFIPAMPAGSSAVSATDMQKFMLAHLQDGEYNGARILKPETAQLMHARQFGLHPAMNAMALGFYEETRNGHRIIGHGGDTIYFHSDLHLIPDAKLGFFISYNSAGKGEVNARGALWQKLLDRYFPYVPAVQPTLGSAAQDAAAVAGLYETSRRMETSILAISTPLGNTSVAANPDHTITWEASKGLNGVPKKYREVGPMLFQDVDGQDRIAFVRESGGPWKLVMGYPFMVFQHVSGLRSLPFVRAVGIFSLGAMALAILLWPIAALVRWHFGRKLELAPRVRGLRMLARIVCLIDLACVGVMVYVGGLSSNPAAFNAGLDPTLRIMQLLALIGAIGLIPVLANAILVQRERPWWWLRVQEPAIALACIGFTWMAIYWHILNPSLRY